MKIFITGIAGFLGSNVADKMIEMGHEVVGIDNFLGGYKDNLPENITFYEDDLKNLDNLAEYMEGCDVVFHTACTAYEGLSVFSPSLIVENTVQISVNAMTASIQAGVKRFVHCSSMARYGTQDETPFREDMTPKPQDPYGIAKYAAELLLKNLSDVHGVELVVAVPHNIIGPRQKYDDPFRNVASIMINLMMQGRQPIIYGDGMQTRCFSDINDDIDCLVKLAFTDGINGEIFNIGPDEEEVTINELCSEIANLLRFNVNPVFMPGRPQEVKHATCSADKIRKHLGYETKTSLRDSLQSIIDYIEKRGTRDFKYHLPIELQTDQLPATWKDRLF